MVKKFRRNTQIPLGFLAIIARKPNGRDRSGYFGIYGRVK
jgi:hypothetical protein